MTGKVRRTAKAAASTGGSLISDAKLGQLYATMVQCRLLTEFAQRLPKQLRSAGLYAASMGQEAIATGCAIDLRPEDTIALAPHDSIASLVKGVALCELVEQLYARRNGADIESSDPAPHPAHNIITPSSSPDAQLSAVIRLALANKQKKNSNVVVAFTQEPITTLGCWHEALELSAARSLPIVFVVENNPWADPASVTASDEEKDFVQKAMSYGLPGMVVDGNDVVAVYRVAYESLERVRRGGGPVLVEGTTYSPHGQSKRRSARSETWRTKRDPLTRMERYLRAKHLFTTRAKNQVVQEFSRKLDCAVKATKKARKSPRS